MLICAHLNSFAQVNFLSLPDLTNVRIASISDQDLTSVYQKAMKEGFTQNQIIQSAIQKGLPDAEAKLLNERLNAIAANNSSSQNSDWEISGTHTRTFDTSGGKIPLTSQPTDPAIFGSELFSTNSLVFEPNLRIPPPPNYMLGPDDELIVSVYGYSEKRYVLTVNELGEVYIPNVGPILVSGLTIEQATDKIRNKLGSTIYTAIKSGQTKVQVTLGKIRSIRVTVIGQARKPGTYTVSSLTTLYNALYLCGGPADMGSYREIEVIRGKEKRKADLYEFLVYGNQKDNILLQEGDVIRIPYYDNRVIISGNVKRVGKFEMLNHETFSDLLKYSGGFTDIAYRGNVTVSRITDSTRKIIDLSSKQFSVFQVKGSDEYTIGKLQDEFGNRIYASGAVQRPGTYELTQNITVKDLIEKAGGLTADAYLHRALIYRYLPNKLPAMESVNLDSVMNLNKEVFLKKNDSLVVSTLFSFKDENAVSVQGNVRKPGHVMLRKNMTLKDVLMVLGGITDGGDSSNIEISRRIQNINVSKLNHSESEVIYVNLLNPAAEDFLLEPHDIILIKEKPGYSSQRTVMIQGEVMSPGRYTLQRSQTKISDIIDRSGGFRASADSTSLTLRRISKSNLTPLERKDLFTRILNLTDDSLSKNPTLQNELYKSFDLVSIDLNKALSDPASSNNLMLEDGDILTVSRSSNLVKVSGEVYFPTIVSFQKGKNLKYYVEQAGNFMPNSRKGGALVIQPDGSVNSVKHFLFFKLYPQVKPRSEIFVPKKEKSNRTKMGAAEWALIVSALGIVSNVIINTSK